MAKVVASPSEIIEAQFAYLASVCSGAMLSEAEVRSLKILIEAKLLLERVTSPDDSVLPDESLDSLYKLAGKPNA